MQHLPRRYFTMNSDNFVSELLVMSKYQIIKEEPG